LLVKAMQVYLTFKLELLIAKLHFYPLTFINLQI
jgi:hypothetical protein